LRRRTHELKPGRSFFEGDVCSALPCSPRRSTFIHHRRESTSTLTMAMLLPCEGQLEIRKEAIADAADSVALCSPHLRVPITPARSWLYNR
jgi:hypothetical protein